MKCEPGDRVEVRDGFFARVKSRFFALKVGVVAAAVPVCSGAFFVNVAMAQTYVTLDVNPSIEFSLNRSEKIVKVTALNEDAEEIVDELYELGIKWEAVDTGLEMALDMLEENDDVQNVYHNWEMPEED
mgnify:CR=1 FL=1